MGYQGEKVNANYWLLYHLPRNWSLSCFYHHYSALLVLINLGLLNKGTGSTLMFFTSVRKLRNACQWCIIFHFIQMGLNVSNNITCINMLYLVNIILKKSCHTIGLYIPMLLGYNIFLPFSCWHGKIINLYYCCLPGTVLGALQVVWHCILITKDNNSNCHLLYIYRVISKVPWIMWLLQQQEHPN